MVKYITFKPNRLIYGQDFTVREGIPTGVRFEVIAVKGDGALTLKAPGFGGTPYGNGRLHLYFKQSLYTRREEPAP